MPTSIVLISNLFILLGWLYFTSKLSRIKWLRNRIQFLDLLFYGSFLVHLACHHDWLTMLWIFTGAEYMLFRYHQAVYNNLGFHSLYPRLTKFYRVFLRVNVLVSEHPSVSFTMLQTQTFLCLIITLIAYVIQFAS